MVMAQDLLFKRSTPTNLHKHQVCTNDLEDNEGFTYKWYVKNRGYKKYQDGGILFKGRYP